MEKGYTHIYTGNGKGKTTAAFGVALRSVLTGYNVYIAQFFKNIRYSEVDIENHFDNITIELFGSDNFGGDMTDNDRKIIHDGFLKSLDIIKTDKYDLVILDEISIAIMMGIVTTDEVIDLLKSKNPHVELILTGIMMPEELYEYADLVTEMKEIKHYYKEGVLSRRGIDN